MYRGADKKNNLALYIYTLLAPVSTLIIGDSLTDLSHGFYLRDYSSPDARISHLGIHSSDFPEWHFRLNEAFSAEPFPDKFVVAIGTNDAYRYSTQDFLKNVNAFNDRLRLLTTARIYYCLMPLTNDVGLGAKIRDHNSILRQNPPQGIAGIIDLESAFLNAGPLPPLYISDPVHPTQDGYRLIGLTISNSITP